MKILFLLLSLHSLNVWSQGNMCDVVNDQSRVVYNFKRTPNYFFKTSPDGRYLYYIAERKNWMVDLTNGQEMQLPGEADPVPSPDGKLLTYIARGGNGWAINAQTMNPAWIPNPQQTPTALGNLAGSYQSISTKQADGSRILFYGDDEKSGIVVRKLTESGGRVSVGPVNGFGKQYRLPMMSADGTMFSVLNTDLNKTQIYRINPQTAAISLVATLPVAAGKANFSYDNSKITFHLTRSYDPRQNADYLYPAILGDDSSVRNIYTYSLATKKITQVTDNLDTDAYFPVFLANGEILYFGSEPGGKYKLIKSKVSPKVSERKFDSVKACYGDGVESKLVELGELWARACNKWGEKADTDGGLALTSALNMSSADCRKLADKDKEMLKLCDALDNKKVTRTNVEVANPPVADDAGKKIFQNRCAICHEGQSEKIANSASLEERINGSGSNRMPPSGSLLTTAERDELKKYVGKFKK